MQMLFAYNRKLALLAVPLTLWSLCGVAFALGLLPAELRQQGGLPIELGLQRDGLRLPGAVLELAENEGSLTILMARPPQREGQGPEPPPELLARLPAGVEVTYIDPESRPQRRPQISGTLGEPKRLPGGGHVLLSEKYLLRYDRRGLSIMPRPKEMRTPWGERVLQQRIDRADERQQRRDGRRHDEGPPPQGDKERKQRSRPQKPPLDSGGAESRGR